MCHDCFSWHSWYKQNSEIVEKGGENIQHIPLLNCSSMIPSPRTKISEVMRMASTKAIQLKINDRQI